MCSLQVYGETLKHVEKFKHLGVQFTSDERQNTELDTRIDKASAVMLKFQCSVVMKRELTKTANLSIHKSVFLLVLTYGHDSWIMGERFRSRVQALEKRFLRRISGVIVIYQMRSTEICKYL